MSLASELIGSDALARIQSRVNAYWDRQFEKRLIASLRGVLLSNVANNSSDMVNDISGASGTAADFSAEAVIDTAATLGDRLESGGKLRPLPNSGRGEIEISNKINTRAEV
jgi:hypothetical protein